MPRPDRLAKNLVSASLELHRRRSWTKVPPDAPFLIRVPDEDEPLAGVLIGQDGDELGLMLVKGPDALGQVRRAFLEGDPAVDGVDSSGFLSVTFERFGTIPEELRGVLKAAGFQARRENIAPFLFAKPAHRQLRRLNRGEMRTLAWCLAGIFAAEDRGELRPAAYDCGDRGRRILELEVEGKPRAPEVTTRFVTPPVEEAVIGAGPVLLPVDLGDLARIDENWVAGLVLLPGRIEGDVRTMHAVLILDEESEQVLGTEIVPGGDLAAAVSVLVGTLRQRGLPRELVFTSESFLESVAPGLAAIGVSCLLDPEEPLWWSAASELTAVLERMEPADEPGPAEPRTLEDWKQVELRITRGLVADLLERGFLTPRATKRYFGSEEIAAEVRHEHEQLSVTPAFIEWLVADYRPTRRSRTYVEKRLERKDLDPVERTLLEARRDAVLSFFRVVSCVPGASLEVEDLLSDRRFTLQDRSLSTSELEGWHLPLRVFRMGDWYVPGVAGPPVNAFHVDRVLTRLEAAGMTLEPDELRKDAHLFGRMWSWFLEEGARPVELQNTDGDPLEWHSAEFNVADPAALVSALEGHDDVIIDEPGAEWSWVREGGPGGLGDTTTLCRLLLFDDSLVAEVNSARRFETARAWLETLPGVRFTSVQRSDFDDAQERPLDDRLPGPPPAPLSPELIADLERHMEEQALRWLDESVPALGELTPRAACATEDGRRRVARLIRTMPAMRVPGGEIPVPRERILHELGL